MNKTKGKNFYLSTKDYADAVSTHGIVIACGMAKYKDDECVAIVFERADQIMYENKNSLKNG